VFEAGQSYVALSRIKSLEGVSIMSYDVTRILVNKRVKAFYGGLDSPAVSPIKREKEREEEEEKRKEKN